MSYFKINIKELEECINNTNTFIGFLKEDIDNVYNNLNNVDSGWNDINGLAFKETIKKDKYETLEYLNYLEELILVINNFKTNIKKLCSSTYENVLLLSFNNNNMNTIEIKVNNILSYLSNARRYLDKLEYTSFSNRVIYNYKSEIKEIRDSINNLFEFLKSFSLSVEKELNDTRIQIRKASQNCVYNVDVMQFNWQISDISLNGAKNVKQEFENNHSNNIF